jgi:hypothetical protein
VRQPVAAARIPPAPPSCPTLQVEAQRVEWEALHARLAPHLPPPVASLEEWLWALSCVRSRSFAAPELPLPLGRVAAGAAAAQAAVVAAGAAGGAAAAAGAEALVVAAAAGAAAWAARGGGGGGGGGEGGGRRVLCPFIDLFNHDSSTSSCCELDSWSGDFKVAAREALAAGAEVTGRARAPWGSRASRAAPACADAPRAAACARAIAALHPIPPPRRCR